MKTRYLITGMAITIGMMSTVQAAVPSTSELKASAAEPMDLVKVLHQASGIEIIQALKNVIEMAEEVESSISIESRIIGITAIGTTMAKDEAPAAATAIWESAPTPYKPLVAATAVLISGKRSNAVKQSLLSAANEEERQAIASAVTHPRKDVLSKNQAGIAAQYARLAAQHAFASNQFYLSLDDDTKGGTGNTGAFTRGSGVNLSFFSKAFRAFFDSPDSIRALEQLSEETAVQLQADFDTFGAECARCRLDVLKLGLNGHPFWQDFEFTRQMSCETLCALRSVSTSILVQIRALGVDSDEFRIAINELKKGKSANLLFYKGNLVLPGVKVPGFN